MTATLPSSGACPRALPDRPNLEHLRNEAKSRLKQMRAADPTAQLAMVQRDLARDYGFPSWRRLRAEVRRLTEGRTETDKDRMERLKIGQARPRTEVRIDPKVVDGYVGFYELTPKTIIVVQRDANDLIVRLTGQSFYSIIPESSRKFSIEIAISRHRSASWSVQMAPRPPPSFIRTGLNRPLRGSGKTGRTPPRHGGRRGRLRIRRPLEVKRLCVGSSRRLSGAARNSRA